MLDGKCLICDDGENDVQIDPAAPDVTVENLNVSFLPNRSQDFLGQAFCTLGEIFGSLGCRLEKPLR